MYQYRQNRTSNNHSTELIQNSLMVDPIKCCAEISLQDPTLLPSLQCTLPCMRHAEKCITGIQTFPISKLGGWKHTSLHSINRPRRTDTRRSNTLDNTDVMEIDRQLATEEDGRPFGIGVTLACLQQAGKLPRRTSRRNTTLRRGARTSAVLLRKRGNIPNGSEPP